MADVTRAPLVSVVIPVRNASATLGAQLDALARQDHRGPWEVVIVDNGSTDDTAAVAAGWADRLPGLRVVSAVDRAGPAYARNVGAAEAKGELLVYCDGDDVASPGWLAAMVAAARDADVVGGRLDDTILNTAVTRSWRPAPPTDAAPPVQRFLPAAASANLAIRKEVLEDLGGWREDYVAGYEDVELCWRAQLAGRRFAFAPGAVMGYRYRTGLRDLARQYYAYGRMAPRLYRDFGPHGMPRSDLRTTAGAWKRVVADLPRAVRSPEARGVWVRNAATRLGRLVGCVRHRAFFP